METKTRSKIKRAVRVKVNAPEAPNLNGSNGAHHVEKEPPVDIAPAPPAPPVPPPPVPYKKRDPKTFIRWTDEELNNLATKVAELRLESINDSMLQLIERAQEQVFTPDRRRKIYTTAMVSETFLTKVKVKVDAIVYSTNNPPELDPVIINIPTPVPVDRAEFIKGISTPELAAEFVFRVIQEYGDLRDIVKQLAQGITKEPIHTRSTRPPASKTPAVKEHRKPVVVVMGLFLEQFRHVEEKLAGQDVDLRHVDNELKTITIPQAADYVIVQRHTRHRAFEAAREAVGNSKVVFVHGGISEVVQKVYDFLSRRKTA